MDPGYDPSKAPPQPYWEGGAGGPRGDPYGDRYSEPRYSFQPPPPAYAQYPPPLYAYPYAYPPYYKRPTNPALAVAGGVMSITAGSLSIIGIAFFWSGLGLLFWSTGFDWCIAIGVVLAIIAIVGGIFAMMKRLYPLALIGAICSMLSFGFFGVSFMIGLIAVILIGISKDAFDAQTPVPFFQ